ncbi:arginase family protein [Kamptonema cortianum]|nr:arginase family protein [Geitlerinema splendidum]MDK3158562.1 arginase family protein [Kamptonema cortianum]
MSDRLLNDPNWPRAHDWLAGDLIGEAWTTLAVVGAPSRLGSLTPGRCDLAPDAIRSALQKFCPYDVDQLRDLRHVLVSDQDNLPIASKSPEELYETVRDGVEQALRSHDAVVLLGGDNAITRPGIHGLGVPLEQCGLITLDAHLDLRHLDDGLTNGNPVRALLKDGLPAENIAQVGIQNFANSMVYANVAFQEGIHVLSMTQVHRNGLEACLQAALDRMPEQVTHIYFDLDLDTLDRTFAPGTPGSRPGGIAPWQMIAAAEQMGSDPRVVAMDLVELDPERDTGSVVAQTAAMCLLSFASGLLGREIE